MLQDNIDLLSKRLADVTLDTAQQTVSHFTASHHDMLKILSDRLDSIAALHNDFRTGSDEQRIVDARQKIRDSLYFPQIHDRKSHIVRPYNKTYQWILDPTHRPTQSWSHFTSWLGSSGGEGHIYWVSGKIGAGKTTLLRFLDQNVDPAVHMHPWAEKAPLVKASCFFWRAGSTLQKSMGGLLQTLLLQLFEQTPEFISKAVQLKTWQTACFANSNSIHWTDAELRECLWEYILCATKSKKIFLLVDGLDEFGGTDDELEDLVKFMVHAATHENVKICLSSRPWNIFLDAFEGYPN